MAYRERGFSLIELLVSLTIVGAILVGTWASFSSFVDITRQTTDITQRMEDVSIATTMLERDIKHSGFGIPLEVRVAGDDGANGQSIGPDVEESVVKMDLDNDGTKTSTIYTDRLFLADGMKILRDTTVKNDKDLKIATTDLEKKLARKAEEDAMSGGFFAVLTADKTRGATSLGVADLNINSGVEAPVAAGSAGWNYDDILAQRAIILGGGQSASFVSEGHRTGAAVAARSIAFYGGRSATSTTFAVQPDVLANPYAVRDTKLVPAIAWYIDKKSNDTGYWLYRNNAKVLPGVYDFQVRFGFDMDKDGLEWADSVPPASANEINAGERAEIYSILSSPSFSKKDIVKALKAVQVTMLVRQPNGSLEPHQLSIRLPN